MNKLLPWCLALFIGAAHAAPEDELLPAEQAFRLAARIEASTVRATWDIAPGYYLYRDKFKFEALDAALRLGAPEFPKGKRKDDPYFGPSEIYTGRVTVRIPFERTTTADRARLRVTAQGCNEPVGICYPPLTQEVALELPRAQGTAGSLLSKNSNNGSGNGLDLIGGTGADEAVDPLDAFHVDVVAVGTTALGVRFSIADCCYLYKGKTLFSISRTDGAPLRDGPRLGAVDLPPGEVVTDEFFGRTEIYRRNVDVRVPLLSATAIREFALNVTYQGCAEKGVVICYEPITRRFPITYADGQLLIGSAAIVEQAAGGSPTGGGAASASSSTLALAMLAAFGAGLLLTFTPCVLPMIPIVSSVLVGAEGKRLTKWRGGSLSYTYVLGTALTYTVAGAVAGATGEQLQAYFQNPWALGLFSAVLVLFALSMFGLYELRVPAAVQTFLHRHSARVHHKTRRWVGGEVIGVFVLGVFSALIIGACVTPILASTLTAAIASQDPTLGAATMFALAHGQGAILVAIGVSEGVLLPRSGPWMNTIKHVFGVLLIAVAIYLLTPLPQVPVLLLWGALFIMCAVYLGATQALPKEANGWRYLWKGIGTLLLVWGVLALLGGFAGGRDILRPLPHELAGQIGSNPSVAASEAAKTGNPFERVASVHDLDARLVEARRVGKPVVLDYYATWCTDCVRMEQSTFLDPRVREALATRFVALQADITDTGEAARAMKQRFNVFGPPALLFLDTNGVEQRELRSYGYLTADELTAILARL